MTKNNTLRRFAAGALPSSAILLTLFNAGASSFLVSDVTTWIGPQAGPGVSQSVLVIQWPSQPAWAWGYRWESSSPRDGRDLLLALAGSDARFSLAGTAFITDLRWDADLDGTPEFTFPGFNAASGEYLNFFVNNNQQPEVYADGAAPAGAHILPPLGSPYDEAGPGAWISSNTGILGRPVVDGSWDGWVYSEGSAVPAQPVNAPIPIRETLASWRAFQFRGASLTSSNESALWGNNADPDSDGLSNLMEYAMTTPPLTANALPVSVGGSNGRPALAFPRNPLRKDLRYTVEGSSTLLADSWSPLASGEAGAALSAVGAELPLIVEALSGNTIQVTVSDSLAHTIQAKRYLRLRATLLP